ncbi:MAG: glycosyl hydrolase family 8 [Elusimicrobiota bacterium]|nr:glycosyl hydrolase family 8 [Endomicrobiia bacterium]MDW8165674.1 glycosyl hydrolase family 8 [Elusimicrobiota bacterium]
MLKFTSIHKYYFILLFIFSFSFVSFSAKFPFPQFKNYPYGIKVNNYTQQEMITHLQNTFLAWKGNYLTKTGAPKGTYRIQRGSANEYDTVSEGIGYGMLILVFTDNHINTNRCFFDGLYRYYQCYLDQNGLMHWQIDREGNIKGYNAATDADEDVALALIFAHYQWGSEGAINYLEEAKKIITRIMKYQVEKPSYILKPGDSFGGSDLTNPSYFAFSWFRIFKEITQDSNWEKVIDACYSLLNKAAHPQTGLIPDWCDINGKEVSGYGYNYYYDACRVPWRVGVDYIWYGESRAYEINNKIINWSTSTTQGDVNRIVAGYRLDGTPLVNYSNAAFVGPFGVGSMVDPKFQQYCNALYTRLINFPNGGQWGYYQDCLKMISMLVMTGNFINFTQEGSDFTIPTCQIISPIEDEIISENKNIEIVASDSKEIKKLQLFYNNTLIYETNISSKICQISYHWDVTNFLNSTGTLKAVVYNLENSSYVYTINISVLPKQSKSADGSGKVMIYPANLIVNNIEDINITYTATHNLELAEVDFILPDWFNVNLENVEIKTRVGSPVVLKYSLEENVFKIKFLKISKGESIDIVFEDILIDANIGSYEILVKTKNNGGIEKEIEELPKIHIHSVSNTNSDIKINKKLISLNNDYINELIYFDSNDVGIYNLHGERITTTGKNNFWNGKIGNSFEEVPSGIYFYKTQTGKRGIIYIIK